MQAPPIPLQPRPCAAGDDTGDVEYLHVRLSGHFLHAHERHVFALDDRLGPGFHVYTPLVTSDKQLVLVNRGFVPVPLKEASDTIRRAGGGRGDADRLGAPADAAQAAFVPASEPERNMLYWPDYPSMLGSAREAGQGDLAPVPFFVDADAEPANAGGFPRGGVTRLVLPNRHLEYALTWYGLALTLIGVFAAFARGRLRAAHAA